MQVLDFNKCGDHLKCYVQEKYVLGSVKRALVVSIN